MLYDKLKDYAHSGVYPFHMPGHKRTAGGGLPYDIDITEIDGFDNLHAPGGCLRELQENAAGLFGAKHAFALVNGSTVGILAAVRAMTRDGDRVLIARNCHMAVYHAAELCRLNTAYLVPAAVEGLDLFASVSPRAVEEKLRDHPDISLVVITSPTYEGIVSDVSRIADICHARGARLLIDEAHGAHFPFSDRFPTSAVRCGADAAVTSLHKTLPSMTQTALLLTNDDGLSAEFKRQLGVFETSSPSYVLLASVDRCLGFLRNSESAFDAYIRRLDAFYQGCASLRRLYVPRDLFKTSDEVFDCDIGKVNILCRGYMSGRKLMDLLRRDYRIEAEAAIGDRVIAMTSVCDTDEGFDRLLRALKEIDSRLDRTEPAPAAAPCPLPRKHLTVSEALDTDGVICDIFAAEGRISREYIRAYPPGIPLIVPGEEISREVLERLGYLHNAGGEILTDSGRYPFISIIG